MNNVKIKLLSLRLAARRVGVREKDLQQAAEDGTIPCTKVGDQFVFNIEAVEKVLLKRAANNANKKE